MLKRSGGRYLPRFVPVLAGDGCVLPGLQSAGANETPASSDSEPSCPWRRGFRLNAWADPRQLFVEGVAPRDESVCVGERGRGLCNATRRAPGLALPASTTCPSLVLGSRCARFSEVVRCRRRKRGSSIPRPAPAQASDFILPSATDRAGSTNAWCACVNVRSLRPNIDFPVSTARARRLWSRSASLSPLTRIAAREALGVIGVARGD